MPLNDDLNRYPTISDPNRGAGQLGSVPPIPQPTISPSTRSSTVNSLQRGANNTLGNLSQAYRQGGVPQALGAATNEVLQSGQGLLSSAVNLYNQADRGVQQAATQFGQGLLGSTQQAQQQPVPAPSPLLSQLPDRTPLNLSVPATVEQGGLGQAASQIRADQIPQSATNGPFALGTQGNPNIQRTVENGVTRYETPQGTAEFQGQPAQTPGLFGGYATDAQARAANPQLFEQLSPTGQGLGLAQAFQQQANQLQQDRELRTLNRQAGRLRNRIAARQPTPDTNDPAQLAAIQQTRAQNRQGLQGALEQITGQLSGQAAGQQQQFDNQLAQQELQLNAASELAKAQSNDDSIKTLDNLFGDVFTRAYSESVAAQQFNADGAQAIDPVQAATQAANQAVDGLLGTRNEYLYQGKRLSFIDMADQARKAMQTSGRTADQIVAGLRAQGARGNLDQLLAILQ